MRATRLLLAAWLMVVMASAPAVADSEQPGAETLGHQLFDELSEQLLARIAE